VPDVVAVAVAVAAVLIGPQLAEAVGTYAVIGFAWIGGAMVGCYRMEPGPRRRLLFFLASSFVVTIGMTVTLAHAVVALVPSWAQSPEGAKALFFPVAVLIPMFWEDWPKWGKVIITALIQRRFGGGDK
jgi:peptidoglycan/LPS O-acetylase OafA/YrhL